jgi:hypothetical protein
MSKQVADDLLAAAKNNLRDTLKELVASGADPREHLFMVISADGETTVGVCSLAEYAREVIMNDGPASLSDWLEKALPSDHQRVIVDIDGSVFPYTFQAK